MSSPTDLALVAEAARKSRVCWLAWSHPGGEVRDRLVWHLWHDDALVVVDGDDHQELPGLADTTEVRVTLRSKEARTALVSCTAHPDVVPPGTPAWDEHASALLAVRLNLADPAATRDAWAREARLVRLTPAP
ncbi:hypothetical protein [Nocardioides caldifontis]|uniref:hypothetical protein n=1 Tax=Nocardioides caldifontis TaxID=2588938 RepID=UPI0011DF64E7|nr:hypothetical protein [Nocardioides caldifontis]